MIIHSLDKVFKDTIRELNDKEREKHVSSGKLSASRLGWALQWQVLHLMGIETPEVDDYVLCLFARGKDVEEKVIDILKMKLRITDVQKEVEYKNTVGVVDFIFKDEPYEVKSVKNSKFKRIETQGDADPQVILQACFYAMAMKAPRFHIVYVSADDYRIEHFVKETADYSESVDKVIREASEAFQTGIVPEFEPRYKWQKNAKYASYPDYINLTSKEATLKAKEKDERL